MARRSQRRSSSGGAAKTFDFAGVEGGRKRIPSGDYKFIVDSVNEAEGDAGEYWKVISKIPDGPQKGFKAWINLSHSKKALWKMRQFLEACGMEVPETKMKLRKKDLVGLVFGGSVEDDTYEGKTRSKVTDFFPVDELEDDEDDEDDESEESSEEEEDDEEEEEDDDEEDEEDDEEKVVDDDEDDEEDDPPKKKKTKKKKKAKK